MQHHRCFVVGVGKRGIVSGGRLFAVASSSVGNRAGIKNRLLLERQVGSPLQCRKNNDLHEARCSFNVKIRRA